LVLLPHEDKIQVATFAQSKLEQKLSSFFSVLGELAIQTQKKPGINSWYHRQLLYTSVRTAGASHSPIKGV
jgi:hypothetical protein